MSSETASILVVAGETSGEHHAAGLIEQVKAQNPQMNLLWYGSGGSLMSGAGVELLSHVSQLAAIGPRAALAQMGQYWQLYRRILEESRRRRPRLAILVDFPEFNLFLAPRLKRMKIPICYFIGPQVWAWRPGRINRIRKFVDLMLVIFPFEAEYYRSRGVKAHYVGNPTADLNQRGAGSEDVLKASKGVQEPVVAMFPGSRKREVELILPAMLDAAARVSSHLPVRFLVSRAPEIEKGLIGSILQRWLEKGNASVNLEIVEGMTTRQILARSTCAVVKSGTSTLEATVQGVPFAMVYKVSWLSWFLAKPLVSTTTYCLTNLIAGERIVPELVQREATGQKIASYLIEMLENHDLRCRVAQDLSRAAMKLGHRNAYREGAAHVSRLLGHLT